jgi:hypothetical protein
MGNHCHLLFIVHDAEQCSRFFAELQKQLTDAIKKLLGLRHLILWEGAPSIAIVLDLEKAAERIRYLYCNPARANLVDSIAQYPGLSSWKDYVEAKGGVDECSTKLVPWIRQRVLPVLSTRRLSATQDLHITGKLLRAKHRMHELSIFPNAWFRVFDIEDPNEIAAVNQEILGEIRLHEASYRTDRIREGKRVLGAKALAETPILAPHSPKERSRRIYVLSSIKELRTQFIEDMRAVCDYCRHLYQRLKDGASVIWPPGVFAPRAPILANSIAGP